MARAATVSLLAAIALLVAGCGDDDPADATPPGTPPQTAPSTPASGQPSETLPAHGAPKVETPITDTKAFQDNPCSALSTANLDELGLPHQGKTTRGASGPVCRWYDENTGADASIQWELGNPQGLTAAYRDRVTYELFEPLDPLGGNPALAADPVSSRSELDEDGSCTVLVGVTDSLIFQTGVALSRANRGKNDPCEAAYGVAEMMITNIRGG